MMRRDTLGYDTTRIRYGTIRHGTMRYDTDTTLLVRYHGYGYDTPVRYDTTRYDTIRCDTIPMQYNSTVNTIQYETIRYDR